MLLEKVETKVSPISRYQVLVVSNNEGKFFLYDGVMGVYQIRSNGMNIYDSSINNWIINITLLLLIIILFPKY